jgi:F-type H+-transporting ATPase subunit delta
VLWGERLRLHPITANFLGVVLRNQRMSRLEDIQTAVEALMDARRGIVPVEVTTAIPLGSVSERRLLERRLKEVVGADIRLTYKAIPRPDWWHCGPGGKHLLRWFDPHPTG